MEKISLKKREELYTARHWTHRSRKYTAMKYTTTLEAAMGKICRAAHCSWFATHSHQTQYTAHPKSIHTACFSSGRYDAGVGINSALAMLEKFSNQSSAGKTHFFEIDMKRPAAASCIHESGYLHSLSISGGVHFAGCAYTRRGLVK